MSRRVGMQRRAKKFGLQLKIADAEKKSMITERYLALTEQAADYVLRGLNVATHFCKRGIVAQLAVERLAVFQNDATGRWRFGKLAGHTDFELQRLVLPSDDHRLDHTLPKLLAALPVGTADIIQPFHRRAERLQRAQDSFTGRLAELAEAVTISELNAVETTEAVQ